MSTLFKGLSVVGSFLILWFGLSQVNWMAVFNIDDDTIDLEEKLGEYLYDNMKEEYGEVKDSLTTTVLEQLIQHLIEENDLDPGSVKLHVMDDDLVNAFAMPDGHILLFRGLVDKAENQYAVAGVLAHEMAHVQERHVMKKLIKEVGLSVLITMTTGDKGPQVAQQVTQLLTSTAFDREMEREADEMAVSYLVEANMSPEPLADFLYELSLEQDDLVHKLSWLSTHPNLEERAKEMLELGKDQVKISIPVIEEETWDQLLEQVRD